MTVAVKNNNKAPLVVPAAVRRRAGFRSGEEIEFRASGGLITIVPKSRDAEEEYSPQQRRIVNAQLSKADADLKAGRVYGPFDSAEQMAASIEAHIAKRRRPTKKSPSRR